MSLHTQSFYIQKGPGHTSRSAFLFYSTTTKYTSRWTLTSQSFHSFPHFPSHLTQLFRKAISFFLLLCTSLPLRISYSWSSHSIQAKQVDSSYHCTFASTKLEKVGIYFMHLLSTTPHSAQELLRCKCSSSHSFHNLFLPMFYVFQPFSYSINQHPLISLYCMFQHGYLSLILSRDTFEAPCFMRTI
jgi:hypothetical protein